jgi:hypothetical protein
MLMDVSFIMTMAMWMFWSDSKETDGSSFTQP